MSEVKVTKRGNIKVDGVKYYAVPWVSGSASTDCRGCIVYASGTSATCHELPCTRSERPDTYRLPNQDVGFVTADEYAAIQASVKSTKES